MQIYRIKSRYDNKLNAKDLALGKINAGPKMFGLYAYGISIGMSIPELALIINSKQGKILSKVMEGNMVIGQQGQSSVSSALKYLQEKLPESTLSQFDFNLVGKSGVARFMCDGERCATASELFSKFIEQYYISRAPSPKRHSAGELITRYAVRGKLNDVISSFLSSDVFKNVIQTCKSSEYTEGKEFVQSIYQLLEFLQEYEKLAHDFAVDDLQAELSFALQTSSNPIETIKNVYKKYKFNITTEKANTIYNEIVLNNNRTNRAKDLKILAEGAEEMRVLGSILSSNKGVKTKVEEGYSFISTIENAIINRKEALGKKSTAEDKVDYVRFCMDPEYKEKMIEAYEKVKHSINILEVISVAPHFNSYLRASSIPYAGFMAASSKYRSRQAMITKSPDLFKTLKITSTKDKEAAIRGLESGINAHMLIDWLGASGKKFMLPAGCQMFTADEELITVTEDTPIALNSLEGLATFKLYMDTEVIPKLKHKKTGALNVYADNKFVQGLIPFELSKTSTHSTVTAYTLKGEDLMSDSEINDDYKADFQYMEFEKFPKSNGKAGYIPNYMEAFYLYAEYVYGGKKNSRSLMTLFDGVQSKYQQQFRQAKAEYDATREFILSKNEQIKWASLTGSTFRPKYTFFYAQSGDTLGVHLLTIEKDPDTGRKTPVILGGVKEGQAGQNFLYPINTVHSTHANISSKFPGLCYNSQGFFFKENTNAEPIIAEALEEINKNLKMTSIGVYKDGSIQRSVVDISIVESALEQVLKKYKGLC